MKKIIALLSVVLILSPEISMAAEMDSEQMLFQEIPSVVTASKKLESIEEAPGIVTVVTGDEIRRYGAKNLRQILDRMPSVYTLGSTLFRDNTVSIRGDLSTHINTHVLFLLNGRPVRDSLVGGNDEALQKTLPVDSIDRIEFVRGPGSVLYGSGAYTGAINIITKDGKEKNEIKASGGYGSFNAHNFKGSASASKNDMSFYGGASYFKMDGWKFEAVDERSIRKYGYMGEHNVGMNLKGKIKNFTLDGFYGDTTYQELGGSGQNWPMENMTMTRMFLDAGYKQPLFEGWDAGMNLTYNGQHKFIIDQDKTQRDRPSHDTVAELTVSGNVLNDLNLLFGGVADRRSGESLPEASKYLNTQLSAYAQADYRMFKILKLVAGGQYIKPEFGGSDFVPRYGAILNSAPWGAKLLYGEAFRSAYAVETDLSDVTILGNPSLQPEKIKTVDAQVSYTTKKIQISNTYFWSMQTDRIVRIPAGTRFTFVNRGELTSQGAEFEAKVFPLPQLSLLSSYMYQANHDHLNRDDVTFMPNNMIKLGGSYAWKRGVTLGIFDSYFANRFDVNVITPTRKKVNPDSTGQYHWMTANLIFNLTKLFKVSKGPKVDLKLFGENLLNETVYDPAFNRQLVNTLPARSGISFLGEVEVSF